MKNENLNSDRHSILIPVSEYKTINKLKQNISELENKILEEKNSKTIYLRFAGVPHDIKQTDIKLLMIDYEMIPNSFKIEIEHLPSRFRSDIEKCVNTAYSYISGHDLYHMKKYGNETKLFNNDLQKQILKEIENKSSEISEQIENNNRHIKQIPKIIRWIFKIKTV